MIPIKTSERPTKAIPQRITARAPTRSINAPAILPALHHGGGGLCVGRAHPQPGTDCQLVSHLAWKVHGLCLLGTRSGGRGFSNPDPFLNRKLWLATGVRSHRRFNPCSSLSGGNMDHTLDTAGNGSAP